MTTFLTIWAALATLATVGLVVAYLHSWRIILRESDRADAAEAGGDQAAEETADLQITVRDQGSEISDLKARVLELTEEKTILQRQLDGRPV